MNDLSWKLNTIGAPFNDDVVIERISKLKGRNRQAFWLLTRGFTSEEIAEHLGISNRAAIAAAYRACQHFGLDSRNELIPYTLPAIVRRGIRNPEIGRKL